MFKTLTVEKNALKREISIILQPLPGIPETRQVWTVRISIKMFYDKCFSLLTIQITYLIKIFKFTFRSDWAFEHKQ